MAKAIFVLELAGILSSDHDYIVVLKPSGVTTVPGGGGVKFRGFPSLLYSATYETAGNVVRVEGRFISFFCVFYLDSGIDNFVTGELGIRGRTLPADLILRATDGSSAVLPRGKNMIDFRLPCKESSEAVSIEDLLANAPPAQPGS